MTDTFDCIAAVRSSPRFIMAYHNKAGTRWYVQMRTAKGGAYTYHGKSQLEAYQRAAGIYRPEEGINGHGG